MGESFSKHHSSLYGYEKQTNPLLEKLVQDSSLIVFKNVTSAGLSTMISFKYMFSGYSPESEKDKEWYNFPLLQDILHSAGYSMHWFSNHANVGVHNNVTRLLAEASDDNHFCGNSLSGDFRTSYDEEEVKLAKNFLSSYDKNNYNFYVFHLMGSHFKFDLRYPSNFVKFTEKDYQNRPLNQRSTLAAYDNSILYNDYVVNEIISLFKEREAIIIYLSDHGLDIYNSSDTYAAHGKPNDPISAKFGSDIPFIVYTSQSYRNNNPKIINQLKQKTATPFRTDNFMNFVIEISGIKYTVE